MNIVIADDDMFVSGALKTILQASGKITVAATGSDGTEAVDLRQNPSAGRASHGYPYGRKKRNWDASA